jgi:hypothetical protein
MMNCPGVVLKWTCLCDLRLYLGALLFSLVSRLVRASADRSVDFGLPLFRCSGVTVFSAVVRIGVSGSGIRDGGVSCGFGVKTGVGMLWVRSFGVVLSVWVTIYVDSWTVMLLRGQPALSRSVLTITFFPVPWARCIS